MTSTRVTRERGIGLLLALVLMARTPQQPDPIAQCAVEKDRDAIREREHHRHHHGSLRDEGQTG